MADVKISALNALGAAPAAADLIPVVDVSGSETKKLRIDELFTNPNVTGTVTADGLTVDSSGATYFNATVDGATGLTTLKSTNNSTGGSLKIQTGGSDRLQFAANGDISFYEDTGTTAKFFWDASAESLGIGTTSPDKLLHVLTSTTAAITPVIKLQGNFSTNDHSEGTSIDWVASGDSSAVGSRIIGTRAAAGANMDLRFHTGRDTFAMAIDEAGNVGIGTASPLAKLDVDGQVFIGKGLGNDISNETDLALYGNALIASQSSLRYGTVSGEHIWYTGLTSNTGGIAGGSERMRIDSSGNLLVGKSTADNTTVGFTVYNDNGYSVVRDSNPLGIYNRLTTDGDLMVFRKDGTTVGSIGTRLNRMYIGTGDTGVLFDSTNNAITPENTSTPTSLDATIDLGRSTTRFKDLYLSGGVYLGGTGADNLLDDYETGTWTPTLEGNTTAGTYDITPTATRYTKIGNLVTVRGRLTITVTSAGSGLAKFGGLPFSVSGSNPANGAVRSSGIAFPSGVSYLTTGIWTSNSSDFAIIGVADNAGTTTLDVSSISTGDYIEFTLVYVTS